MKPTQTGIAVALALALVVFFFILPGFSPFGSAAPTGAPQELQFNQSSTTTMPTITELQITDEKVGTGAVAEAGDTVTVQYVGSLTDGRVFDASANHGDTGFTFTLGAGQVIRGWDEGLVGMKEGGVRKLAIPAEKAYGNQSIGNVIPANSALLFDVELVKVQKGR